MPTNQRNQAVLGLKTLAVVTLFSVSGLALTQQEVMPPLAPLNLQGDPARGEVLAETCSGCHGIPGYRNAYPSYHVPKLGGQNADYIEIALQAYRRGSRPHETMQAQAAVLTDQDIADISAYFASLEREEQRGISAASERAVRQGQEKAATCTACHGPEGKAPAPQWPNIAGQHASYLEQALTQYKTGERSDMVMGPMVAALDDETLEQLAAYFAAQPGLHHTDEM